MTGSESETRPRRPRRRRKEARPGEIIEAGLQEFAERGFAGAKLEDVATRAGIVKGTIYRYFDSKEALFEAALKSRMSPILDQVGGLVDAFPGSSADALRLIIPRFYQELFGSDVHILMRIIISEGARFPAISELYYRETISKGRRLIERLVARGIERGEFRRGAVAELPIVVIAPAIMAMVWKMTFDAFDPIETDAFLAAHLDLVLNGLCSRSSEAEVDSSSINTR